LAFVLNYLTQFHFMPLVLCSGFHDRRLTDRFIESLQRASLVVDSYILLPPFSCLDRTLHSREPLTIIGFSAGVVGAIANAHQWQASGGQIKGLIAVDGWGVPLGGNFPIYRLSHDYFTHWSSSLLGSGTQNFYADPPVEHLTLWSSPHEVMGWLVAHDRVERASALTFLSSLLAIDELSIID
jgi:hypothetical protein